MDDSPPTCLYLKRLLEKGRLVYKRAYSDWSNYQDAVNICQYLTQDYTKFVQIAPDYSFGQGSYAVMLDGVFAADWKSIRGDWKSGFLGSGTFVVKFVPVVKDK